MAIKKSDHLRVNEPHVVHETIDGETILLNLGTGNYYSIEWPGTMVWDLLCETGDVDGIKNALLQADTQNQAEVEKAINGFVNTLLDEELVVASKNGEASIVELNGKATELKKAVKNLDKLAVNKYSDMQEMLLLDPIHDVDEKGWPEPKKGE